MGSKWVKQGLCMLDWCPAPDPGSAHHGANLENPGFHMSADAENLIELLGPREVIGQAVNLLVERDDLSRDAAFEMLVQGSSASHRKVREVAAEIIEQRKGG